MSNVIDIVIVMLAAGVLVLGTQAFLSWRPWGYWRRAHRHRAVRGTINLGLGIPKSPTTVDGRKNMDLSIDRDYVLTLDKVTDRGGNPAPIDGAPSFAIDNPDVGQIVITAGDPRVADGTILLVTGSAVGAGGILSASADVDVSGNVKTKELAAVAVVLTGGEATFGSITLGDGIAKA